MIPDTRKICGTHLQFSQCGTIERKKKKIKILDIHWRGKEKAKTYIQCSDILVVAWRSCFCLAWIQKLIGKGSKLRAAKIKGVGLKQHVLTHPPYLGEMSWRKPPTPSFTLEERNSWSIHPMFQLSGGCRKSDFCFAQLWMPVEPSIL